MKTEKFIDNCKRCPVPDDPRFYDIESEEYFTCSMCSCYTCPFLHHCNGQCAKNEDLHNEELERGELDMISRDEWWEEDLSFILEQLVSKASNNSDNEDYSSKYNYCENLCKKYSHMINLWMNYGYGDIYSFEDFYNYVKDGYFIDYDGTGRFIDNNTGENIKTIRCNCDWLEKNKPDNSDYIMWFNK